MRGDLDEDNLPVHEPHMLGTRGWRQQATLAWPDLIDTGLGQKKEGLSMTLRTSK